MKAFIGLGANLGDRLASLVRATERLTSLGTLMGRSAVYETAPHGGPDQPDYLNAAVSLQTPLRPRDLLGGLLDIEASLGRVRVPGLRDQPRTLDLDVLLLGEHGEQVLHLPDSPALIVPHPRLQERT